MHAVVEVIPLELLYPELDALEPAVDPTLFDVATEQPYVQDPLQIIVERCADWPTANTSVWAPTGEHIFVRAAVDPDEQPVLPNGVTRYDWEDQILFDKQRENYFAAIRAKEIRRTERANGREIRAEARGDWICGMGAKIKDYLAARPERQAARRQKAATKAAIALASVSMRPSRDILLPHRSLMAI